MNGTKQRILLVWYWVFSIAQGMALFTFVKIFPPPEPTWPADRLAEWYQSHDTAVLVGATILGWTTGSLIQFAVVVWYQARRVEAGAKIWSTLILVSCSLTSVFIAILSLCFGAAAYTPERAPEITQLMHQFGVLAMVTTDQLYIGAWVAMTIVCFTTPDTPDNPFPRWWGWTTAWTIVLLEPGALAFLFKGGPFAVNGFLAFWIPVVGFALWTVGQTVLIWRALRVQDQLEQQGPEVRVGEDGAQDRAATGVIA